MFTRIGRAGVLAAVLLLAACGTAAPSTRTIPVRTSGQTVALHVGDRLVVTLTSTYWQPQAPQPSGVLRVISSRTVGVPPSSKTCVPGQGCGTVTVIYQAAKPGHALMRATRTICGEAMRCVTPSSKLFTVTVNVS